MFCSRAVRVTVTIGSRTTLRSHSPWPVHCGRQRDRQTLQLGPSPSAWGLGRQERGRPCF